MNNCSCEIDGYRLVRLSGKEVFVLDRNNIIIGSNEEEDLGSEFKSDVNLTPCSFKDYSYRSRVVPFEIVEGHEIKVEVVGNFSKKLINFNNRSAEIIPNDISRIDWFKLHLKVADPFESLWHVRHPYHLPVDSIFEFSEVYLPDILKHFGKAISTYVAKEEFSKLSPTKFGADREVYVGKNYIYKCEKRNAGQHMVELFYSLKLSNPLHIPLVTVFEHDTRGLVLVFPKLEDTIPDGTNLVDYLRTFIEDDGSLLISYYNQTMMFDGIVVANGSFNLMTKKGFPVFFDLGELLAERHLPVT